MLEPDTIEGLRRGFAARGDIVAVTAFTGENAETWSFAKLTEISGRLGARLARYDIAPGDGVAIIASNSLPWIAAGGELLPHHRLLKEI